MLTTILPPLSTVFPYHFKHQIRKNTLYTPSHWSYPVNSRHRSMFIQSPELVTSIITDQINRKENQSLKVKLNKCQRGKCKRTPNRNGIYCKWHVDCRTCRFEGCEKNSKTGGFCVSHGGGRRCTINDCYKLASKAGYCQKHYTSQSILVL